MFPSPSRPLQLPGIGVIILLLGLTFYPGTLASPYVTSNDSPQYAHTVIPESSALYEDYTDEYSPEVYQYEELSPTAQELFDRTRATEPRYSGIRRYIPDVCRDFMFVCDTYSQDDLPNEFTYGTLLSPEEAYLIIEDDDEQFLLETGWTGHGGLFALPLNFLTRWLTLLPLAATIAVDTRNPESSRTRNLTIGLGLLVCVLGILAPYIEMTGLVSALHIGFVLLCMVWLMILTRSGHKFYQKIGPMT